MNQGTIPFLSISLLWQLSEAIQLGEYQTLESQLPSLVDLDWIGNLLALTVVSVREDRRKVWATVDLAKVCINADSLPC